MEKTYIILCDRHNNCFGDEWCLFWGYGESRGGYTGDPLMAHRFTEEEAMKINDEDDIALDISKLGLGKEYPENYNKNLRTLVEKGTINKIYGLSLSKS